MAGTYSTGNVISGRAFQLRPATAAAPAAAPAPTYSASRPASSLTGRTFTSRLPGSTSAAAGTPMGTIDSSTGTTTYGIPDWLAAAGQSAAGQLASFSQGQPNITADTVSAAQFPDVNLRPYMNPYIADLMAELDRTGAVQRNEIRARGAGMGAFGNSGITLAESQQRADQSRQAGTIRADAFNTGAGLWQADRNAQLQADMSNQSARLEAARANEAARLARQQALVSGLSAIPVARTTTTSQTGTRQAIPARPDRYIRGVRGQTMFNPAYDEWVQQYGSAADVFAA